MRSPNYMNKSSMRGIFLSTTLLFSITLATIPAIVYAEEIKVTSFALEETTIIEVTNDSNEEVNTFRIWLGSGFSFESFKTEKDWMGEKTPQGVIIFTTSETINPGESVKFGVKTDKEKPGINWKALDKEDKQMDTGKVLPEELSDVIQDNKPKPDQNTGNTDKSMSAESFFRIIPEKPNVGSSIRVTGDNFGTSQEFDFYIDSKKIGSFETDENGHFMTTMKIPDDQKADRVDFKVKDKEGEEKKISLRIVEIENRIPDSDIVKLTIEGIPEVVHRGDVLEIFGTGQPNSAITVEITAPKGGVINARTAEIDSKGNWKLDKPIIVVLDAALGKYSATVTDGRENVLKHWTVESDKVIIMAPTSLKFEPGETMKFNGTALPNKSIELAIEDPLGKEIFSDIVQTDNSGFVEFEFPTSQSTTEGTYTLIATQEKEIEFIFAGLGELPSIPVNLEFDKLNYDSGETAVISLTGTGSDVVSLLFVNPGDKPIGEAISITLQPDGRGTYSLDLTGYSSGVYTAVISKGSTQNSEFFAIGLRTDSDNIDINTTKLDYLPGDSVLILGKTTDENVLLTVTLINPEGKEIRIKETFSDENKKISEDTFRIPSDGISGTWIINAKSGAIFDNVEIEVLATLSEGMQITVEEGANIPGSGQIITIKVIGAKQTVGIEITSADNEIIETLSFPASAQGEINLPWIIPKNTEPGTYTVRASDAFDSAETTYELQ